MFLPFVRLLLALETHGSSLFPAHQASLVLSNDMLMITREYHPAEMCIDPLLSDAPLDVIHATMLRAMYIYGAVNSPPFSWTCFSIAF